MKNLGNMLKEAQKLQSRMAEMQAKLAETEISGTAGAGLVNVTLNGKGEMRALKIDPSLAEPGEIEVLEDLIVAFAPDQQNTNRILRGSKDPESRSDELLLEWLNADSAYGFRATRRLLTQRTPYQMLEVFETPQWGRLFRLDGSYMSSEGDEFFYHEPIVHAAAIPHASPRSALTVAVTTVRSADAPLRPSVALSAIA